MILSYYKNKQTEKGFTLFELLVAMSIFAIMLATALPNLSEVFNSFERNSFLSQVVADLSEARALSLSKGARGVFSISEDGSSYSFGIDTLELNDPPSADTILFNRNFSSKNSLSASSTILFSSRGYLVDEYGELVNININLARNNEQFCSGTIYTVGSFLYDCN